MKELSSTKMPVIAALCSFLLGVTVLIGWYIHSSAIIQIFPHLIPMQFNSAIGFLLSGLGLLAMMNNRLGLSLSCGIVVTLIGLLTILQYIFAIDLAIDQLLMDAYITVNTLYAGRMAPNSALCFIFIGLAIILMTVSKVNPRALALLETLGLLTLACSVIAVAGYIIGDTDSYAWGSYTRMALHTSGGFIILSLGILIAVWQYKDKTIASVPLWLPVLLCFIVLLFDLYHPAGVAAGVAYVPLVFISLLFYRKEMAYFFAGLASILTVLGYFASADMGVNDQFVILNRLLSIMAVWITAVMVYLQKSTLEKLHKSEEALTLGWRGTGDGMWDWDVLTDTVIFSERFKSLLGYQPDELPNQFEEWASRLHADDKAQTLAALESHIKNHSPYDVEYRLVTKSGQWRWFRACGQALWDAQGNPTRVAGSLSDITERKETEIQLQLLQLAVENLKDVVVITEADPDNPVIVFVNRTSHEICGYKPEEMIGRTPSFLQGEKTDRVQLDAIKTALKNNQPYYTELLNYAKDGREYWIDINIVPVQDKQGNTTHFAAIERDITKSKAATLERERLITALEKSNSELDDFAYVASHDLKAPLRVIENVSHWLEEDLGEQLDQDSIENLQLLRSRVMRMDKLLDDLLEYSRVGRKVDATFSEVILGEQLITDITLLLAMPEGFCVTATAAFKQLEFNRMPLQLILLNLISNAIKHREKDSGVIEVSVKEQKTQYLIAVKDDGPGIATEYHEKIFKMFQTLKPRDRVEGSGMGLAIVRKHVELFGGRINVESIEGQGCTFLFTWPKKQKALTQQETA